MVRSIPKFKSFVPKIPQPGPEKSQPPSETATRDDASRKGELTERKHHRRSHDSRDTRDRNRSRIDRDRRELSSRDEGKDHFMVDRVGDPKNLTYGSLHKYSVPRYFRAGYGSIVGLMRDIKIDRDASSSSEVVFEHHDARTKKQRNLLAASSTRESRHKLIRYSDQHDDFAANSMYLSVGSKKRKRGGDTLHDDAVDYRSIEGKAKPPAHPDTDATGDESEDDSNAENIARQKHATLVKATQLHPNNAKAWVELIDWQSRLIHPGVDSQNFSRGQRRTLADLRLHIYEKALKMVDAGDRSGFLNAMLLEGSVLWDVPTQMRKWREALDSDPGAGTLWIKYLDLLQYPESPFKYEDRKSAMLDLLGHVNMLRKRPQSSVTVTSLEETHIHIFIRLIRMMLDAGYIELSIAIIQNAIPLHLDRVNGSGSLPERLARLESAWDEELPRFGEAKAVLSNLLLNVRSHQTKSGKLPYKSFAEHEQVLSRQLEMPGRSTDEDDNEIPDDGFHILFFSDIKDVLASTDVGFDQQLVLDALLAFFDLPPIPYSRQGAWRTDPMLFRESILGSDDDISEWQGQSTALARKGSCQLSSSLLTRHNDFFPQLLISRPAALAFVEAGLEALLSNHLLGPQLRHYLLAFHLHFFPATAAKRAKKLIKLYPSDAQLYNGAAHIEAILGNTEKAAHIWGSSIGAFNATIRSLDVGSDSDHQWRNRLAIILLSHYWAWTELRRGDLPAAAKALASIRVDQSKDESTDLSASTKLGLHRDLSNGFDAALTRGEIENIVLCSSTLVLLTYLTSNLSTTSSLKTLNALITTIRSSSLSHTAPDTTSILISHLHHLKIPLITAHLDAHRPYRPSSLSESVTDSLTLYPSSPDLLALYARLTTTLTDLLDPRLHALSRPWLRLDPTTPLPNWLSAISQTLIRYDRGRATADSVRALFRRACLGEGSRVAHCPGLWRGWFDFELRVLRKLDAGKSGSGVGAVGKKERKNVERQVKLVRGVFFDGLREVPGDKEWVLRGLEVFEAPGPANMEESQLRSLYRTLFEREMRVRVEMEGWSNHRP